MKLSDYIFDAIADAGVRHVFFLPGLGKGATAIQRPSFRGEKTSPPSRSPLRSLSAASELTEQQARRIDSLVSTALARLVEVERVVEEVLVPPANRVAGWLAALRSLRTLVDFYRGLRG